MSLLTWKMIKRITWVEMQLPGDVIDFVNRKALSNTSITSDVEIRLGDKIIEGGLTYMDEVGFTVNEDNIETNPDKLSGIQPPDEINKNIEIHPIEPRNTYPKGYETRGQKHWQVL